MTVNNSNVQTFLAKKIANRINNQFGTDLQISSAELNFSGNFDLNDFVIYDHKNDTLVYLESFNLSPQSLKNVFNQKIDFQSIKFNGLKLNLIRYKDEEKTNLEFFLSKIKSNDDTNSNNPTSSLQQIDDITFSSSHFSYNDQNLPNENYEIYNLNFKLIDIVNSNKDLSFMIDKLNFKNNLGFDVQDLKTELVLSDDQIELKNTKLIYFDSEINGDLSIDISKLSNNNFNSIRDLDSTNVKIEIYDSKILPANLNSINKKNLISNFDIWNFELSLEGSVNDLIINKFNLSSGIELLSFNGNLSNIIGNNPNLSFELKQIEINSSSSSINSIFPNVFGSVIPSSVKNLGNFNFNGEISFNKSEIKSDFVLGVDKGIIKSSLNVLDFSNIDNSSYSGFVQGFNVDISRFLNFKSIRNTNFDFDINGKGFTTEYLNSVIKGSITDLMLNETKLSNIEIFGQVKDQVFDGNLIVDDKNLNLEFNGLVDFTGDLIDFDFNSKIKNAFLKDLGFEDNGIIQGNFDVKLRGNNTDNLIGDLKLQNIIYTQADRSVTFDQLDAQLRNNDGDRIVNISSSDMISGILIGEYDVFNLKDDILNSIGSHYSNFKGKSNYQNISFSLNFKPKLMKLINNNLSIDENTFFRGKFNEDGKYEIQLESSFLKFKDILISDIDLDLNNDEGFIQIKDIKSTIVNGTNFNIKTNFFDDNLFVESSYMAKKKINRINFNHTIDSSNKSLITFENMELTINDQKWEIDKKNPTNKLPQLVFSWDKRDYSFLDANFKSNDQFLAVNFLENENSSEYSINFVNLSLKNITNSKNKIFFEGLVNGKIELIKKGDLYEGKSNLTLKDLSANSNNLGDATLKIDASKDLKSFVMDFGIEKNKNKILSLNGNFGIEKDFFPLDLQLNMYGFSIMPFSKIGDNVITDFRGKFDSSVKISGNTNEPVFDGIISNNNVEFKIPYLNVDYKLANNPSFQLSNQSFKIKDFELLHSKSKSTGKLNGLITHNKFKEWFLDLNISTNNLQILETNSENQNLYYGNAFLDGFANINGPGERLSIEIIGSTNNGTYITIPLSDSKNTGDLSYLTFNTKNKRINSKSNDGLKVNLDLEFNKNARIDVILDPVSESKLEVNGFGNLDFLINTTGNFNVFGNYEVESGSYFYKSLGIVDREFNLKKGSTIVWNGDPYLAELNINANYEVPGGANPAIILQNTSFNRKIPTNIDVSLSGNLSEINTPDFKINFPNTRGPIKSELDYYLVDDEKTQKQAISLLYQGTFIDEISLSSVSSQAITNNLFQKASGIIDDIFTNSEDKMNIGINYMKGDKNAASSLLNRDRLGLSLKTEISDKILINGKIGVPVSGVEDNVVIGNVQIDFLLNPSGTMKARVFNKENQYQYFANDIGYTQGLGISYEIEFDSFKDLFKKSKIKK